jgi:hypothetical protein
LNSICAILSSVNEKQLQTAANDIMEISQTIEGLGIMNHNLNMILTKAKISLLIAEKNMDGAR